jgi:ATP-binding cassette, subfamily B, bacterial
LRRRFAAHLAIVRALPAAGRRVVVAAICVHLLAGVLPVLFILETSVLIARVPAAVRGGLDSQAWIDLRFSLVVAAALFVLQTILAPIQHLVNLRIARNFDVAARGRIMRASFSSDSVAMLEEQEAAGALRTAGESFQGWIYTPGDACAGFVALISRYTTALAMAAAVGFVFSWPAGVALAAAGFGLRAIWRSAFARFSNEWSAQDAPRRRAWYYRDLGVRAPAAKEIRVFGLIGWVRERYRSASLEWLRPVFRARRRIFFGPFVPTILLAMAAVGATLAFAAHAAIGGALSLQALALVMQASIGTMRVAAFYPESDVQTQFGMLGWRALLTVERIVAERAEASSLPIEAASAEDVPMRRIRFEHVSFSYPRSESAVFSDLSLVLEAGTSTGIVGLNGSGKTTLVKLLARLYEPDLGRITVDDVDVRSFPIRSWQRRIGAIFQDYVHYELPLRDNVGFGAIERIRDERGILVALERAGALALAEDLPLGLETTLSRAYEGGSELSGGEWQRVAIARALFAVSGGASILVLDEPTANLDVRAEAEFFDRFLELTRGLTTLVISHRFSTVRRADRIVVLEEGSVIEQGRHDELLAQDGRYAQLFRLQAARFGLNDSELDQELE